jgi:hypothetical protein
MNSFEGDEIARFPGGRLSHPLIIRAVRREGMIQGKQKHVRYRYREDDQGKRPILNPHKYTPAQTKTLRCAA